MVDIIVLSIREYITLNSAFCLLVNTQLILLDEIKWKKHIASLLLKIIIQSSAV